MNPDLVAQITRLVLAKLEGAEESRTPSLSTEELNRWNEISASIQRTNRNPVNGTNNELQALSTEEINCWNEITERMRHRQHQASATTGQVKLYSHS